MQCIHCNYPNSHVVDTKYKDNKNLVERRRECIKCGFRFTTHEQLKTQNAKRIEINHG